MFDDFILDVWHKFYNEKIAISRVEFAKRLGISAGCLYNFLDNRVRTRKTAEKITDYLGMAMVYQNGKYRLVEKDRIREE